VLVACIRDLGIQSVSSSYRGKKEMRVFAADAHSKGLLDFEICCVVQAPRFSRNLVFGASAGLHFGDHFARFEERCWRITCHMGGLRCHFFQLGLAKSYAGLLDLAVGINPKHGGDVCEAIFV
jgi:hypothetical protein